jgi:lipopolysaccharide/colanic/teichoic acid biosynthesis glycosyltransferase
LEGSITKTLKKLLERVMLEAHSKPPSHFERRTNEPPHRERLSAQGHASYGPAANSNSPATDLGLNNAARVPPLGRVAKRGFDIVVAVAGLLILSPTFLLISIAIKLISPGSIFRPEVRRGFNNEHISVFNFRIATKAENHEGLFGRILLSTGIGRFPQLINVLRGEMSIVGPDPLMLIPIKDFERQILPILRKMKPGITGWARVNGYWDESNNPERMQHRLELDQFYVERWSLLFDMQIILMTMFSRLASP